MALVFDIKRYCINDGPGIRITIFLKGCPLSCVWCHNPEGIANHKEKLYTKKKCIGCQSCVEVCPQHALKLTCEGIVTDPQLCVLCGKCVEACPTLAMEMSGTEYPIEYLMEQIRKEIPVMDGSGGGVTFCGGEPLMHADYLMELLDRCGELSLHRAVDTTLLAKPDVIRQVMSKCELLLVDLKLMDSEKHRYYCGVPNELILSNIRMVSEAGMRFFIRIPLIEGVNADEENITRSADFLASLPKKPDVVNLLPYHDIGKNKHEKLGTIYNPKHIPMAAPSPEWQQRCVEIFREKGVKAEIGG